MNIENFFTPQDMQNALVFMERSKLRGSEALPYLQTRQKMLAALKYLMNPPAQEPDENGDSTGPSE